MTSNDHDGAYPRIADHALIGDLVAPAAGEHNIQHMYFPDSAVLITRFMADAELPMGFRSTACSRH